MKILNLIEFVVIFLVVSCTPINKSVLEEQNIIKIEQAIDVKKSLAHQTQKEITILNNLEKESLIEPKIQELSINDRNNVLCLALNIYNEARGSIVEDQIATTYVVFNRFYNKSYPLRNKSENKNFCDIVFDKYQFCWTNPDVIKTPKEKESWKHCQELALQLYQNPEHKELAKQFKLKHYVVSSMLNDPQKPKWINDRKLTIKIGKHSYMAIKEQIDDNDNNRNYLTNIIKKGKSLVK